MASAIAHGGSSDDRRMLADSVDAFARRATGTARVREWRERLPGFDREVWREMAALGWAGLLVAERHGGSGLGVADMAVVAERLAAGLAPEPLVPCAVLAARTLARCDDGGLSAELLGRLASGELIPAVAFQERAGDLGSLEPHTRARADARGLTLEGTKRFVAGAAGADGFVVSGRSEAGTVLAWVPAGTEGLEVTCHPLADGRFAGTVELRRVAVPAAHLLARENNAPDALARALDEATAVVGAELLGLMGSALEMTLEYLRTRVQFGRPIGTFQALQHRSVDLYIQQQLASASLADALQALDERPDAVATAATVSRAKARCSDAAALITRQAIQMHGAIGFTEDSDVGLYVKRAVTLGAWLGNSAYHRRRFARLAGNDEERGA